jgi:DNA-binding transcriptional regulator YiaG
MQRSDLKARTLARETCQSGLAPILRQALHLSIREVAEAVDVDPATVSRWERRLAVPTGNGATRFGELIARWITPQAES